MLLTIMNDMLSCKVGILSLSLVDIITVAELRMLPDIYFDLFAWKLGSWL